MAVIPSPFAVVSLLAGVVSLIVIGYAWQRRGEPGAISFIAMMGSIAVWAVSYGVALTVFDPGLRRALEVPIWAGRASLPVAWVAFALAYTGRGDLVRPRLVALLLLSPAVTLVLIWTNPAHGLVWQDYQVVSQYGAAAAVYEYGPWFTWQVTYAYTLVGSGIILLLEPLLAEDALYTEQGAVLLGGTFIAVVPNLLWLLEIGPTPDIDLTPAALTITGILFASALFRYQLLGSSPAVRRVGRRAAIDDFGDGVVILDDDRRIVDLNARAERVLGQDRTDLLERPVSDVLPGDVAVEPGTVEIELDTPQGHRRFEITVSAITDTRHGQRFGYTLVFHDVTDREQRRQHLEVLTRALRHNLRNDLNVIQLAADELGDLTDGEEAETAFVNTIETQAADLIELSDKVGTMKQLLDRSDHEPVAVDVGALADRIVARTSEEYPDAEIVTDIPAGLEVVTRGGVLEAVIENAVENGIVHNDADTPHVDIAAERAELAGWITVSIADDGPGIPEHELVPLERGTETALEHASGVGLWLVRWGSGALGGEVEFETGAEGTTVTLRFPDRADE